MSTCMFIYVYIYIFPRILLCMPRIGNHQRVFPKSGDIYAFETPDVLPAFLIRQPAAALMQSLFAQSKQSCLKKSPLDMGCHQWRFQICHDQFDFFPLRLHL